MPQVEFEVPADFRLCGVLAVYQMPRHMRGISANTPRFPFIIELAKKP